jgi:hypothetical protein
VKSSGRKVPIVVVVAVVVVVNAKMMLLFLPRLVRERSNTTCGRISRRTGRRSTGSMGRT